MVQVNSIESDLEEILAGSRDGERLAQRRLYERFHRKVFGLAVRLVSPREADDVTQEVFLRVFAGLGSFRGASAFPTWLYRVAVNECLRYRRSLPHKPDALVADPVSPACAPGQRLEQAELLEHALMRLETPLRTVFLLRHGEGLSYKQIASVLGVPISTAATQLGRARAELQRMIRAID
jgi:RNA polymerase sigma-70 factor (ECF subfamily)